MYVPMKIDPREIQTFVLGMLVVYSIHAFFREYLIFIFPFAMLMMLVGMFWESVERRVENEAE